MAGLTEAESLAKYGTVAYTGWGSAEAEADWKAKGSKPQATTDGLYERREPQGEEEEFADLIAQLTGSPITLPPLKVKSFEEYEKEALEELRPYYERILKEEGGDVERAKRRMEEDYGRGLRMKREDYELAKETYGPYLKEGETLPEYLARTRIKGTQGMFLEEGQELVGQLGRRGVFYGGLAEQARGKLATSQQRRQEAIDRALARYEEEAGLGYTRGVEDLDIALERRKFELGEEKKERAGLLGRQKRADVISTQEIERENLMRKAVQQTYG